MEPVEITTELLGRRVLDAAGSRLGHVDALYRDLADPMIFFASVAMIRRLHRKRVFVSLIDARVSPASISVRCGAQLARSAPHPRPGSDVSADLEADVYRHYDLVYAPHGDSGGRLRLMTPGMHRQ